MTTNESSLGTDAAISITGEIVFGAPSQTAVQGLGGGLTHTKALGIAGTGFSVVVGSVAVIDELNNGSKTGAMVQATGIAGNVGGAMAGGKIGAVAGLSTGPVTSAILGLAGAVIGGIAGEKTIEAIVTDLLDTSNDQPAPGANDHLPEADDSTTVIIVPGVNGSETAYFTDPDTGLRVKTSVNIDSDTGDLTAVTTTVLGSNPTTGTANDLLIGNTYPAGAVQVGNELNGLDQVIEETGGGSFNNDDDDDDDGSSFGGGSGGSIGDTSGGSSGGGSSGGGGWTMPTQGTSPDDFQYDSDVGSPDDWQYAFPIALDLDGDGIEINFGQNVYFDFDDDGFKEQTSWISADDGFLVLDLNADGTRGAGDDKIDQSREIAFSLWGNDGDTDLQALRRSFDDNDDGKLDASDAVWHELKIWQDSNQNGIADEGELRSLSDWGISEISLGYDDDSAYEDIDDDITVFGNTLSGLASFVMNGQTVTGGVGDLTLSYLAQGWRRVETAVGYSIDFENGETLNYVVMDGSGNANANLVTDWLDGITGDARANSLTSLGHTRAVQISGGDGDDSIAGGQMDDMLSGDAGADELRGGGGNDLLFFDEFDTVVLGETGYDTAVYTGDSTTGLNISLTAASIEAMYGSEAGDTFTAINGNRAVTVNAIGGNDTVIGSHENDILSGGDGNDSLRGEIGSDTLIGGDGLDTLYGGSGDDLLMGGDENDALFGEHGDDDFYGGDGADAIWGGTGDDYLVGGAGNDHLHGQGGDDVLIAGEGNDLVIDEYGVTWIEAGDGDDRIRLGHELNSGGYATTYGSVLGGAGFDTIELQGLASDWAWTSTINANGVLQFALSRGAVKFSVIDVEQLRFMGDNTTVSLSGTDSTVDNSDNFEAYRNAIQWAWLDANWSQTSPTNGHELHFGLYGAGTYVGDGTNEIVVGGIGTDVIDGAGGNDSLQGNEGSDILLGSDGDDTLNGGSGSDTLIGGANNDWIDGVEGNDVIAGGEGNDTLHGQFGDDVIYGDGGDDSVNGGWGSDTVYGGAGNDSLNGERGNDRVDGGAGDDTIIGYTGNDQLLGGNGNDILHGGFGFDALSGGAGIDTLYGNEGDDWLVGGDGDDTLFGQAGNDRLEGGVGADIINGGEGVDTASYQNAASGVYFWLDNNNASSFSGDATGDVFDSIENAIGSSFADTIYGTLGHNLIIGGTGNDTILSRDGNDELTGGGGNDLLKGQDGIDKLFGGDGDDILFGGAGADQLIGGEGNDRAQYSGATSGIVLDLIHLTLNSGEALGDTFDSIESLFGTGHIDDIRGDNLNNIIWGWHGDDVLHGRGGSDKLLGGTGNDILYGGAGGDTLDGGDGVDRAMYYATDAGFLADLQYMHLNTGAATGDTYISIENLHGGSGNDDLRGNEFDNWVWGGAGNDQVHGREGNDTLVGHSGADQFNFNIGWDQDQVNDFDDNVDTIAFKNFGLIDVQDALGHATQSGNNVVFDFGGGDTFTVLNTSIAALTDDIVVI